MKTSLTFLAASLAFALTALAENPFLNAKSDEPTSAKFKGLEWNDEWGADDVPWSARVTTKRLATAPWGAFFKITFDQVATKAPEKREVRALYFFTTDNAIVLFNEEKPEDLIPKLAAEPQPPKFEPTDIYGITKGSRKVGESDKVSSATLSAKGDRSTYEWTHNSGHFTRAIWQRGVGLVEFAQGYGARKDGYNLKRVVATKGK